MSARDGYGTILHVDLGSGRLWKEPLERRLLSDFLGGRGLAARFLWEAVGKETDPLGPENVLIFMTGALTGTHAPESGRTTVSAKGPATGLYLKSNVGGHLGIALKMAGYTGVYVHGAAERPVYLYIDEDRVELRRASHLWGKGVRETTAALGRQDGKPCTVACIGPAGERRVKFASIMVSYYHAAGRGGIGAVMGSKRLKAIVVARSDREVRVADPEGFEAVVRASRRALYADSSAPNLYKYGTSATIELLNEMRLLPSYNWKRSHVEGAERISGPYLVERGYLKRRKGCGSCVMSCHRFTAVEEGKYAGTRSGGPEYETFAALGSGTGLTRTEAVLRANELVNDFGLDSISTGVVIQWLIETYERGLIRKEDLEGLEPRWGDEEAEIELIKRIAQRRGIGDLLAEGVRAAAEAIGGDSWKWAVQTRGLEHSSVETRGAFSYALAFAVNPRGPDHLHTECLAEFGGSPEAIRLIKRITGHERYAVPHILDKRAEIVRWHEDIYAVTDSLGLCAFATTAEYGIDEEKCARLFQCATGIPMDAARIMEAGRRIVTLERCFNARQGQDRRHDVLPWRMMNEYQEDLRGDGEDGDPIVTREKLDLMLTRYYELHEWDVETGNPTPQTLRKLGLAFVLEEG